MKPFNSYGRLLLLSKGVIFIDQLVLGDSILTVSVDEGLIYTEVGVDLHQKVDGRYALLNCKIVFPVSGLASSRCKCGRKFLKDLHQQLLNSSHFRSPHL